VKCGNLKQSKSFKNNPITTLGSTRKDKIATSKKEARVERVKAPQMQLKLASSHKCLVFAI
jgi:hypothetical protein